MGRNKLPDDKRLAVELRFSVTVDDAAFVNRQGVAQDYLRGLVIREREKDDRERKRRERGPK